MDKLFSKHYGFSQRRQREPIVEAAPTFLRIPFIRNILADRTYHGYGFTKLRRPLQVSELSESLYVLFQKERGRQGDYGFAEDLEPLLMDCEWFQFYDAVELIGEWLPDEQYADSFQSQQWWLDRFGFDSYRNAVNDLLGNVVPYGGLIKRAG